MAQYLRELPEYGLRLQVKAGLTGYAQVYDKYNTVPEDKLKLDLIYIAKRSVQFDLQIIFYTLKIIFIPESTEGIADGQTTAMQDSPEADGKQD
jgi:lipopolysaccharide/colanic/teichoic acid biosynthesis glycosyltransferase